MEIARYEERRMNIKVFAVLTAFSWMGMSEVAHACSPYGYIGAKWIQLGGSSSPVGNCIDDEHDDGAGGRIQTFQYGSIDWDGQSNAAYAVYGLIRAKWQQLGGPTWGHPIDDETGAPDGYGRYNWFRANNGFTSTIYFNPRGYYCAQEKICEAYVVYGAILNEWARLNYERGPLGYPSSDEKDNKDWGAQPGERISLFDNGIIAWRPDGSMLSKLYPGHCLSETGSYVIDQQNGIDWCPY
jgi:uncharacterized protein with LGFP repeats